MSGSFPTLLRRVLRPRFGLRGLLLTIATLGALLAVGRFWFKDGEVRWQKFSRQRVQEETTKGNAVLVIFTADWDSTSLAHKQVVFERPDVRALFVTRGIVPLEADYTKIDPAIETELHSLSRTSIPLVVIYPAGSAAPIVLRGAVSTDHLKTAIRSATMHPVVRLLQYPVLYGGVGLFLLIGIAWWLARRQNQPAAETLVHEVPFTGCLDAND